MLDRIALAIIDAAKSAGIDPPALLALVEVETGGKAFEQDGRTPALLYERHVAYREASKFGKVLITRFAAAGLAVPKWSPKTQYKDQGSSAAKLALFAKAKAIDPEIACRACSWGLAQILGANYAMLGFASAVKLYEHCATEAGQIDCLIRELHASHIIEPLNEHDWPHVARLYNGRAYAENHYDTKLADAWRRWSRRINLYPRETPPEQLLSADEVRGVQSRLTELGYRPGAIDGLWGDHTAGAMAAFQRHEGFAADSHYSPETKAALSVALPLKTNPEPPQARRKAKGVVGAVVAASIGAGGVTYGTLPAGKPDPAIQATQARVVVLEQAVTELRGSIEDVRKPVDPVPLPPAKPKPVIRAPLNILMVK